MSMSDPVNSGSEPSAVDMSANHEAVKSSATELAYEWIKRSIITDLLHAGQKVDEKRIATVLGCSRTPVREALQRLGSEGFVETSPRRGISVRALSLADLNDLYVVATALETMAVRLIAARKPGRQELSALYGACDQMEQALEMKDAAAWTDADESFHRALLVASDNVRLAQAGILHRELAQRAHFIADRARAGSNKKKSTLIHRQLVQLLEAGDIEAAVDNHARQRENGSKILLGAIERIGLRSF